MEEPAIEAQHLDFILDGHVLLQDISFVAQRGEFIGLIGPNGAGKSTLLRCLDGINSIDAGVVRVGGRLLVGMKKREAARLIGYMPQELDTVFSFSVRDVVLAGRYPYTGWRRQLSAKDYDIARWCLEQTDTMALAGKPINLLSGGERQRVMFARVLAQQTAVLLLDEPTASLDISYQEDIFRYVEKICQNGCTVIMAVHDLRLAARFCSRLLLLTAGQLIADGKATDVLTEQNLFKAYGIGAKVFTNNITGQLDVFSYGCQRQAAGLRLHIIGGGGAACSIMRLCFAAGYEFTGGVFNAGDSDLDCAEALGMEVVVVPSFAPIDSGAKARNEALILAADVIVLCSIAVNAANLPNLLSAAKARKLVVIEDEPFASRDYTDSKKATQFYCKLADRAYTVDAEGFAKLVGAGFAALYDT